VLELGGLAGVALLDELSLELGAFGACLLFDAVRAFGGGVRALLGLLGAPLRGPCHLLGALGLLARQLRVLLGGVAFEL
jgi:hypothetical protein